MSHSRLENDTAFDLIVIGSGCAGLMAALTAAVAGLQVLVLEKAKSVGGTSAMSGAGIWVPANHYADAAGIEDSVAETLMYLSVASPPGWKEVEQELWSSYAKNTPNMLRFVESTTPLRFELLQEPDPLAEMPGGKSAGRMLSPLPLSLRILGPMGRHLRPSTLPHILTYREITTEPWYRKPLRTFIKLLPRLAGRWLHGERAQGSALIAGLLKGCLDARCQIALSAEAADLLTDDSRAVIGVRAAIEGTSRGLLARRGVVIATGGFEWNATLLNEHFPGGVHRIGSPRSNAGDGQRMAAAVGARLERMDQANIYPCLPTVYEGRPHGFPTPFQAAPHAIVVNSAGLRFADEYDANFCEHLDRRDPVSGKPINLPAWVIADARFMAISPVFRWFAAKDPLWIKKASTLRLLANDIGVPADALASTVERFNSFCTENVDRDFGRGESIWDRYKSRRLPGQCTNTALGTIERAPFVAMSFNRSILGTKGGARTNDRGQVLRNDNSVIVGLYCAGNAMANPIGTRALGSGTTIGPCMTWGYICANTILAGNWSSERPEA